MHFSDNNGKFCVCMNCVAFLAFFLRKSMSVGKYFLTFKTGVYVFASPAIYRYAYVDTVVTLVGGA
jgi:hypothetical protein